MEVNVMVVYGAGLVSFLAPCMLPIFPAFLAYLSGVSVKQMERKEGKWRRDVLVAALAYVIGFSLVIVVMGTVAAGVSGWLRWNRVWLERVGGGMVMLMGAMMLGAVRMPGLEKEYRVKLPKWVEKLEHGKALVLGLVFGLAWTPCVGPVLGAVLTLAAMKQSIWQGAMLLMVYALGVSTPFLLAAVMIDQVKRRLTQWVKWSLGVEKVAGGVLVGLGFLVMNNSLGWVSPMLTYNKLNSWLLVMAAKIGRWVRGG